MIPMRRVAAVIAVTALLSSAALPALAALSCASPSHACCVKAGEERGTAIERAPCCKIAVAMKEAAREQFVPRATGSSIAVPAMAPHGFAALTATRAPACMRLPASPPLGPPLRLRI